MRAALLFALLFIGLALAPAGANHFIRNLEKNTGWATAHTTSHCGGNAGHTYGDGYLWASCTPSAMETSNLATSGSSYGCMEGATGSGTFEECKYINTLTLATLPRAQVSDLLAHMNNIDCSHSTCDSAEFQDDEKPRFWNYTASAWGAQTAENSPWTDDGNNNIRDGPVARGLIVACTTGAACPNFIRSTDGQVTMRVMDNDGGLLQNEDGFVTDYMHFRARGDRTPPTAASCATSSGPGCPNGGGGWHNADFTITLSCTDAGTRGAASSGCSGEYCLDGDGTPDCAPSIAGNSISITTEDDWYIRWWMKDHAGNLQRPSGGFNTVADGSIRQWIYLGPFPLTGTADGCADIADFISTTDNYARAPGVSEAGRTWTAYDDNGAGDGAANDFINFDTLITGDNRFAYALTYVWSPVTQTVLLSVGSDDSIKAWVNGNLVINNPTACRAAAKDQDIAWVTLNQGYNTLLIRNGDRTGGWQFTARFVSPSCGSSDVCLFLTAAATNTVATAVDEELGIYQSAPGPGASWVIQQAFVGLDKTSPVANRSWFENNGSDFLYVSPPGTTLWFSDGMGAGQVYTGIEGDARDPIPAGGGTPSGLNGPGGVTYSTEFGETPTNQIPTSSCPNPSGPQPLGPTYCSWTSGHESTQGYGIAAADTAGGSPATVNITDVAGNNPFFGHTYVEDVTAPSTAGPTGVQPWQNTDSGPITLTCTDDLVGCKINTTSGGFTPSEDGSIRRWNILGMFPESGVACGTGAPTPFISPANNHQRRPGFVEAGQTWREHHNGDDIVDLDGEVIQPSTDNNNVVAYAYVNVWSPTARTGELRTGSDDGIQAWVNGVLVINNPNACRAVAKDQDVSAVTLNAGNNTLLLRIGEAGGGWGFTARFTSTGGGTPWTDLRYSTQAFFGDPWYCIDSSGTCEPLNANDYESDNRPSITCPANDVCTRWIRYRSQDRVNNTEAIQSAQFRIDKLPPYSRGPIGEQGWFASNQTVALACVDPPGIDTPAASGCNSAYDPRWCIDTTNTCDPLIAGNDYTGPITIACDDGTACTRYLRYRSRDVAGNDEAALNTSTFRIDRSNPSVTFDGPANGSWFRRNFQVTATDGDNDPVNSTGSGLDQTTIPGNALAGWWKLNEGAGGTTADSSGNGNTGTLVNGAAWITTGQKVGAAAIDFDGTDDSVDVSDPGSSSLDVKGDNITMMAWVYHDATQNGIIINKESAYEFAINGNTLQAAIETASPGGWAWGGSQTIPLATWTHVAFTYNGTYWRFYVNGALAETIAPAGNQYGNIVTNNNPLKIGNRSFAQPFNGRIDDVRIYYEPLSPDQINAIYSITNTYSDDVNCYYRVESSADGSTWTQTQGYLARTCPSGDPTIGIWSNNTAAGFGHDCRDSGDPATNGRCRVTIRTIDNVGRQVDRHGQFRIDWDGPFVNVTDPASHAWKNADFAVVNTVSDQPPGGVASGLNNCTLRIARIPSAGGPWSLVNWSTYPCGTNPVVTVGAGKQCSEEADNSTYPRHRATCLVVTGATDTPTAASVRNPSMLYYPLDENSGTVATDLGPRGINGSIQGGAAWTSDGGYFRHGVNLDGVDDAINVSIPADLNGGPLTNFTIELWVRPDANANRGILSLCDPPSCPIPGRDRAIYTDGSGNICSWVFPHDVGGCSSTLLTNGIWHHIALRVQKGVGADLFRNGTLVRSVPAADHSEFDWASLLSIGYSANATNRFFDGVVDEVKVHFRPLNDTEIAWAAGGAVPGPLATDGEPGGAKHVRIDYTAPVTAWNGPPANTIFNNDFPIDISDSDGQSGLQLCQFRLEQPPGNEILGWTSRACNSATSALVPVGTGSGSCQDTIPEVANNSTDFANATLCRVFVRSTDNAGNFGPNATGVFRDFYVDLISPILRIEGPRDVKTVALYTNSSETCAGTVSDCQNWWFARLKERGFAVLNVTKGQISSLGGMKAVAAGAILNPYGERFPGTGGSPDGNALNIRDFVKGGGFWLDSGGFSFFDPGTGTTGSQHSQAACLDILSNGNQFLNRTRNSSNETSLRNSPFNVQTESPVPDRPSTGMFGSCGPTQRLRGLYVNQTGARYGPALHCYGSGCIGRTDNTSPGRWNQALHNWSFGAPDAIRLKFTTSGVGAGTDSRVYRVFNSTFTYAIQSGDKLEFDVWLDPSSASIAGGFDAVLSVSGTVRDNSGWVDQNGLPIHPANDVWPLGARGRWYHRTFDMSSKAGENLLSPKVVYDSVGTQAVPAGTYEVLLANVVVTDATGRVKQVIHQGGPPGNAAAEGPTADVTSFDVRAVNYAGATPMAFADILRHWLNKDWTIMVEDDDESPGGGFPLVCSRQVRSAGTITVPNATRVCDEDLNITVGPGLNCRDQGDDQCRVDINTTNDTGGTFRFLNFGIDWTRPNTSRDISESSPCAYRANSSWVYYSNSPKCPSGGTFTISSGATDAVSGVAAVAFPDTTSAGGLTRWPGPHDWTYSFTTSPPSTFSGMVTLYVLDNASNSNATQFTVYRDFTAPAGNTGPDYCSGVNPCYNTSWGVVMNIPATSDLESGIPAGGRILYSRTATLSQGTCGAFGDWNVTLIDPPTGSINVSANHGFCYQFTYNVSDNVNNWANSSSANIARIDPTPPNICAPVTLNESSPYAYVSGTTIYYNSNVSGVFNASVQSADDNASGIKNVTFPTTTSAGWFNNSPGPYQGPYTWSTSSTFNASTNATCWNNASLFNNSSFSVLRDIYPPTGNSGPSYTHGFYSVESVTITLPTSLADNLSGIATGGKFLQRRSATLSASTCGAWSAWSDIAVDPASPYTDGTVVTGNCYQYSYNVTDNVNNWANASSASVAMIDITAPQNGSIDYPNGNFDVAPDITFDKGDDPESGLASWRIWRQEANIDCAGNPTQFGPWIAVSPVNVSPSPWTDTSVTPGRAYQYKLVVINGAGVTTEYFDPTGDIYIYQAVVDPNITKQITVYQWNVTYTAAGPTLRWDLHNNTTGVPPDGFSVTQTPSDLRIYHAGSGQTTIFPGWGVSGPFPETHSYLAVYDYACGSGNFTYLYRDGQFVGRAGGANLSFGNSVTLVQSTNAQVNSMVVSPGRWDPPLTFTTASTNASGCTNYVLDSCQISSARPCTGNRAVKGASVNRSVVRPGSHVSVTASYTCALSSDTAISYNNGTGWSNRAFSDNSCGANQTTFANSGNPGVHRVRVSIRDSAEGGAPFTCGTWDADNDDVGFWVAEPVPG